MSSIRPRISRPRSSNWASTRKVTLFVGNADYAVQIQEVSKVFDLLHPIIEMLALLAHHIQSNSLGYNRTCGCLLILVFRDFPRNPF